MVNHGLFTELGRARMSGGDLILYSGVTDACVERILGTEPGTPFTTEDLIDAIGREYEEKAMMSTSTDFDVSLGFMGRGNVMLFILAPQDAMNSLGTFCIDCFREGDEQGNGEAVILFNAGSRFKILDVGTAQKEKWGMHLQCTYVMMELLGKEGDPSEPLNEKIILDNNNTAITGLSDILLIRYIQYRSSHLHIGPVNVCLQ